MQERLGWDTIDETYARMHGFRTRAFPELVAHHHRPWGSADGTLRGRARHGQCAYIVHFTLPWVTLRAFKVARVRPRGLSGVAFLYGYVALRDRPRASGRGPGVPQVRAPGAPRAHPQRARRTGGTSRGVRFRCVGGAGG